MVARNRLWISRNFNFVMACVQNHVESTKFFPKGPLWIWPTVARMVQYLYQEKQKKGTDTSSLLDTDVGTGGLVLEEMENETPTCGFLGSECIIKSCDRGSNQGNCIVSERLESYLQGPSLFSYLKLRMRMKFLMTPQQALACGNINRKLQER